MGEVDNGPHDLPGRVVCEQRLDEGLVDLDRGHGRRCRYESEEFPVPKSSSDRRTP